MVTVSLYDGPRKGTTISLRRMRRDRARPSSELLRIVDDERPRTRAECCDGPRPCLWVSCRFHLYLDVNEVTGSLKLNFPDKEPSELQCSCALDVAEKGGLTLEEIGRLLNVTRERARQLEASGMKKLSTEID
jgi:hypothetical protein